MFYSDDRISNPLQTVVWDRDSHLVEFTVWDNGNISISNHPIDRCRMPKSVVTHLTESLEAIVVLMDPTIRNSKEIIRLFSLEIKRRAAQAVVDSLTEEMQLRRFDTLADQLLRMTPEQVASVPDVAKRMMPEITDVQLNRVVQCAAAGGVGDWDEFCVKGILMDVAGAISYGLKMLNE